MAISSVEDFIGVLKKIERHKDFEYFYRGHSDFNFAPLPSMYRVPKRKKISPFIKNENNIFREVIIRTPADFINERTTIEKLVKMQHYGLPTRILDVTYNPLVALYFACNEKNNEIDGEVLVFGIPRKEVKFYDSDTVSILANLAKSSYNFDISDIITSYKNNSEKRRQLERQLKGSKKLGELLGKNTRSLTVQLLALGSDQDCIKRLNMLEPIPFLLHEIKDEKPHFLPIINPNDFNRVLAVRVKLNNSRILKQSGAFLLFGINGKKSQPAELLPAWIMNRSFRYIDLKINAYRKEAILKELDALAINESTLYPELEKQTQYIKNLYSQ